MYSMSQLEFVHAGATNKKRLWNRLKLPLLVFEVVLCVDAGARFFCGV